MDGGLKATTSHRLLSLTYAQALALLVSDTLSLPPCPASQTWAGLSKLTYVPRDQL